MQRRSWKDRCMYMYLGIVGGLFDNFWRHPEGRADESVPFAGCVRQLASHTKVRELHVAHLAKENVRR